MQLCLQTCFAQQACEICFANPSDPACLSAQCSEFVDLLNKCHPHTGLCATHPTLQICSQGCVALQNSVAQCIGCKDCEMPYHNPYWSCTDRPAVAPEEVFDLVIKGVRLHVDDSYRVIKTRTALGESISCGDGQHDRPMLTDDGLQYAMTRYLANS